MKNVFEALNVDNESNSQSKRKKSKKITLKSVQSVINIMFIVSGCIGLFFIYLTYQNTKQIQIVEQDNNSLISKINSLDDENIVLFSELKELFIKTQELTEKINNKKVKKIKNINHSIHSTNSHMDF